jgi:hypothetical protein
MLEGFAVHEKSPNFAPRKKQKHFSFLSITQLVSSSRG